MTTYSEVTESKLQARIRARYAKETAALEAFGFRLLAFCLETRDPFSAFRYVLLLPFMLAKREVLVFPAPFRLGTAHTVLAHSKPRALVVCLGLGVKFFTEFSNRTILLSSTLASHEALQDPRMQSPRLQIVRTPPCKTIEEAWHSHQQRIATMEGAGLTVNGTGSFADYVDISRRDDEELRHVLSSH